jgi:hypothetical protein
MLEIQPPTLESIIRDLQSLESKMKTNTIHNTLQIINQIGH